MNNQKVISKTVETFKKGGVVIFPTDTVWGIGASLDKPQAIKKLYKLKKREQDKPTAVLVGSIAKAKKLGIINQQANHLIKKFWPGGLTIVVKAKTNVPSSILGPNKTVGLRMPNHQLILAILKKLSLGIVATSANIAGQPVPKEKNQISKELIQAVDLLVDGESQHYIASTVVDATDTPLKVIREGTIPTDKLPLDK